MNTSKEPFRWEMGTRCLLVRKHEDVGAGMTELLGQGIREVACTVSVTLSRAWWLRDALLHRSRLRRMFGVSLEMPFGTCGVLHPRS